MRKLQITIGKNTVRYIQYGEGDDVVLLHGWGQNIEMMHPLGNNISGKRITILDFPGFGESTEPDKSWTIDSYVEFLEEFVRKLKLKNITLIGHSFGGRVAIGYASRNKVDRVVLLGSPCVRCERTSTKEKILKALKKVPLLDGFGEYMKKFIGSEDYKKASPVMREILVSVINQDLSEYAKKIDAPTLLIWGSLDTASPVDDAKKLEQLLKDGALIVLDGYTHYAYLEALPQVSNIINSFLGGK